MIVVTAKLLVQSGKNEAMRGLVLSLAKPTRKEDGNLSYAWYQDAHEPHTWFAFEEWRDQAALDAHFETPDFKRAGAALGGLLAGPPAIRVYEVEGGARELAIA
jgi:quinol monooxygenase YgiN